MYYYLTDRPYVLSNQAPLVQNIYPMIGSSISTSQAIHLCRDYGLMELANKITQNPDQYRSWTFDGVSGLPDHLMGLLGHGFEITYQCALPHDLAYGYGTIGDSKARREADKVFREALRTKAGVSTGKAYLCWTAVRILGSGRLGLSFTWGFADKTRKSLSDTPLTITF